VKSGTLGSPLKVVISDALGYIWNLEHPAELGHTNDPAQSIPPELDYNMWLGPAPWKPYTLHRTHFSFRGYWDYDSGSVTDMGFHWVDPVQYFLGKDNESPVEVIPDTDPQNPDAISRWRRVTLRYADGDTIILDGNGSAGNKFIEGPNGYIGANYVSDIPDLMNILQELPDPPPQEDDFMECMKTRKQFCINEKISHRTCTVVNMASIALQLGRKLMFDSEKQRFIDDEQANRLVYQPMRSPWGLDAPLG
jgi:hypothetical protein